MKEARGSSKEKKRVLSVVPEPSASSSSKTARSKPHRVTLDLSSEQYKKLKFVAIAGKARGIKEGTQSLDSMSAILETAMNIVIDRYPSLSEPLGPDDF